MLVYLNYRDPAGIRTQDPYIKSVMLYQLSYEIVCPPKPWRRWNLILSNCEFGQLKGFSVIEVAKVIE